MASSKEVAAAANKCRRERFKAQGLCTLCGKEPLKTKALGEKCRIKYAVKRQSSTRSRWLADGLCASCGKNPLVNKTMCEPCRVKHKDYTKNRAARLIQAGKCIQCGKVESQKGLQQCVKCTEKSTHRRRLLKRKVYDAYGGAVCRCCGESEEEFLTVDHIENDGAEQRRNVHPTYPGEFYRWLIKNNFPEGFQVLCANCQIGKQRCGGVCPHQTTERRIAA